MASTTADSKGTFRYIPDSGDFAEEGKYYEQKVIAFVSFEALSNSDDFCLISNPPNCAPFDDIILYTRTDGRNALHLFQVKSKLNPTTITDDEIRLEHFPGANGKKKRKNTSKFQIDALYKRFPDAIKEICKITPELYAGNVCKVIIFTNRPVQADSEILELQESVAFCASQGKIYKFKREFIAASSLDVDFLSSVLIYAEQRDSDIDNTTLARMKAYFSSEDDIVEAVKLDYFSCAKNWCELKGEKQSLTGELARKLLTYSAFKSFAVPIEDYNEGAYKKCVRILSEDCFASLWEAIKSENLSVGFELENYALGKVLEDFQRVKCEGSSAKEYELIICNDELKRTNKRRQLEFYVAFLLGELPLIIRDFNLSLKQRLNLKVVWITRDKTQRNWLKINETIRSEIKRVVVRTSCGQSFKVGDVIDGVSNEASISDVINLIINSRSYNESDKREILIPRSLNRILIDKAILSYKSPNDLFVINAKGIKTDWIKNENVLTIKNCNELRNIGEYKFILTNDDFNDFEAHNALNVHFLRFINENSRFIKANELEWIKSKGNISSIKQFRSNYLCKQLRNEINSKVSFDDDCFCCMKMQEIQAGFTIISGIPGAGKTTFLRQFAQTAPPDYFILFVALIEHYNYYDRYDKATTAEQHLTYFYKGEASLLNEFFARKLSAKRVVILFDAFDEIAPKYTQVVREIIGCVRAANYGILLTTRSVLKSKVEDLFATFSLSLNLFYEREVQDYLEAYYKLNAPDLPRDFIEVVKKNLPGDVEFCKVPVNLKLITDVIASGVKTSSCYKLNKLELYERFINYRIGIYSQKIKNTNISESSILTYHKYFCINLLFSKEPVYTRDIRNFIDIQLHRYIKDLKEGAEKVGILIDDLNEIIIHRTVAEFLTAAWLLEITNPANSAKFFQVERDFARVIMRKIFFSNKDNECFPVVGLFFDLMINQNYFHKAAYEGEYKVVKAQAPLNGFNRTILHTIIAKNASLYNEKSLEINQDLIEALKLLIANPYNLTHKDHSEISVEDYVKHKQHNQQPLVILTHKTNVYFSRDFELWEIFLEDAPRLLNALGNVRKLSTIFEAATNGHLGVIQRFYNAGVNVDVSNYIFPCFDKHLVHFAAEAGSLEVVKFLHEVHREKLQVKDEMLRSSAHYSILSGNVELIAYLRENELDYTSYDFDGFSAFHYAVIFDKIKVVKFFLNAGLDINFRTKYFNYNPILLAAAFCNKALFEFLLEQGADMPYRIIYGDTLLHCISSVTSRIKRFCSHMETQFTLQEYDERCFDFVKHLLNKGLDINAKTKTITPLINSAFEGNETLTKFLIVNSADINITNDFGCTVLHAASYNCNIPTLKLLLQHKININAVDVNENSALHYALEKHECLETVKFLIANGANANARNDLGITPLHIAAYGRDLGELKVFVEHSNINIDARNNEGDTPLHYAVYKNKYEIVRYLIEKQADVNLANNRNQTPLDFAIVFEHKRIEMLLRSHDGISKDDKRKDEPKYMSHLSGRFTTKNRRILRYILQFYTQNWKIS